MINLQKKLTDATLRLPALALIAALALSGCASIVGSDKETLSVSSTPPDAQILIIDEEGRTVYRGRTPDSIALPKSNGRYWGGKQFTVAISKRGYRTQRVKVDTHPNVLYMGGNWFFGGLIGWLLVDSTSGQMYELSSDGIQVTLQRLTDDPTRGGALGADGIETLIESPIEPPAEPVPDTAAEPGMPPRFEPPPPIRAAPVLAKPAAAMRPARPANVEPAAVPAVVPPPAAPQAPSMVQGAAAPEINTPALVPKTTEPPPAQAPRPYWPIPPQLPVSPSTALPTGPLIAMR